MPDISLPINNLNQRHVGVTENLAAHYNEAARVCLDRHHDSPKEFSVLDNETFISAAIAWDRCDPTIHSAWDKDEATEFGSYCLALASVESTRGLFAVHRAQRGSGADYYLGPEGSTFDDLETCIRLEVSGTDEGTLSVVNARLQQKIKQTQRGDSNLPALATVVGFAIGRIVSADVV